MESFYMVFVEGGHAPERKHETLEAAVQEAERLCKKQGQRTFIMKAVAACTPMVTWETTVGNMGKLSESVCRIIGEHPK